MLDGKTARVNRAVCLCLQSLMVVSAATAMPASAPVPVAATAVPTAMEVAAAEVMIAEAATEVMVAEAAAMPAMAPAAAKAEAEGDIRAVIIVGGVVVIAIGRRAVGRGVVGTIGIAVRRHWRRRTVVIIR